MTEFLKLFKEPGCRIVLLILVFCIGVVVAAIVLHQFSLLYNFVFISWTILALLWGIPQLYIGIKEVRKARKNGEQISWEKNPRFIQGFIIVLPAFGHLLNFKPLVKSTGWPIADTIMMWTTGLLLVAPLLCAEINFTVFLIRYVQHILHKRANPYTAYLESISTEESPSQEQFK